MTIIKGKTPPRRKPRDIAEDYMDLDTQIELSKQYERDSLFGEIDAKDVAPTEAKRRLQVFEHMRSKMRPVVKPQVVPTVFIHKTVQQRRQRAEGTRSSAASGDGNSDDPDPEPERNPQQLYDQQSLADLLCISKKTLQNQYSVAPYTLPEAIHIPHARGPRWTQKAVEKWLTERPKHTQKLAPVQQKRKAGRPRIAATIAAKGGAK